MRIDEWDELQSMVALCAGDLLASVGLDAKYLGPVGRFGCADSLSMIELAGGLRGVLIVSAPPELLAQTCPAPRPAPADLADWLSELANLVLGRIKCKLLARGVVIQCSTPLGISRSELGEQQFARSPWVHAFSVGARSVHVIFDASDPGHSVTFGVPTELPMEPGEMVLF